MYEFFNANGKILYVGKAKDLKNRVSSYFANASILSGKTKVLVSQVARIKVIRVESELESLLLEAALIKKYVPKYNIRLTDGKAYPLIRITKSYEYPAVITARRPDDGKSEYFGPYPSAGSMRYVLKLLRRIFPYQSVLNHPKRICLYNHLGLCPCPPMFTSDEQKKTYKATIRHIIGFLNGKSKDVIHDLEKERDAYAKDEQYEKASNIQKQLDAIAQVTQPFTRPFEYVTNPNLRSDVREQEMRELQEILQQHGVHIDFPRRIECYDNSNIQGTNPVASMVVATNGEMDKSQYRKFKIKTVKGANDFASMTEVFTRRLKHPEWSFPQLFVVDGGKGQVSAAKGVLQQFQISNIKCQMTNTPSISSGEKSSSSEQRESRSSRASSRVASLPRTGKLLPLIGLAKREEIIITPDLQEIRLPKSSLALQLIMRLRDEAHRFAITFHKSLRNKTTFD